MSSSGRIALALLALVAISGCQSAPPEATPAAPAPKTTAERIKAIQDDPKMPADAKAMAIQQIQGSEASSKATQQDLAGKK